MRRKRGGADTRLPGWSEAGLLQDKAQEGSARGRDPGIRSTGPGTLRQAGLAPGGSKASTALGLGLGKLSSALASLGGSGTLHFRMSPGMAGG